MWGRGWIKAWFSIQVVYSENRRRKEEEKQRKILFEERKLTDDFGPLSRGSPLRILLREEGPGPVSRKRHFVYH